MLLRRPPVGVSRIGSQSRQLFEVDIEERHSVVHKSHRGERRWIPCRPADLPLAGDPFLDVNARLSGVSVFPLFIDDFIAPGPLAPLRVAGAFDIDDPPGSLVSFDEVTADPLVHLMGRQNVGGNDVHGDVKFIDEASAGRGQELHQRQRKGRRELKEIFVSRSGESRGLWIYPLDRLAGAGEEF